MSAAIVTVLWAGVAVSVVLAAVRRAGRERRSVDRFHRNIDVLAHLSEPMASDPEPSRQPAAHVRLVGHGAHRPDPLRPEAPAATPPRRLDAGDSAGVVPEPAPTPPGTCGASDSVAVVAETVASRGGGASGERQAPLVFVDDGPSVGDGGEAAETVPPGPGGSAPRPRPHGHRRRPPRRRAEPAARGRHRAEVAGAVSALALALGLWMGLAGRGSPRLPVARSLPATHSAPRAAPAPTPPLAPVSVSGQEATWVLSPGTTTPQLVLAAAQACWIEARAGQRGPVLYEGILEPGQTETLDLHETLWIRVGNAGGITARAGDRPLSIPVGGPVPYDLIISIQGGGAPA
jgi:hypothetical protein